MEEAFAQKYKVTLLPTNFDRKLELEYLEELLQRDLTAWSSSPAQIISRHFIPT